MMFYPAASFLLLLTATTNAAWVPVAYDMVNSTSLNLNAHTNPYAGAFISSSDGFEKYTRGVSSSIPGPLLDDSLTGSDALGIVDSNDLDEFFGFADTENDENAGAVLASWDFDITGETIDAIQIDAAAMGDFEQTGCTPDWFNWYARVDGGPKTLLFQGVADASLTLAYTMADTSVVELVDPMMINGKALTNKFEPFLAAYSNGGQGSTLTLELEAYAAGSSEATAFRNIEILADDGEPPAPPDETCPEEHCGNDVATTMAPTSTAANCNLQAVRLNSTVYMNGDLHVELRGPANHADAAAIILTAPHGGGVRTNYIPNRTTNDTTFCPPKGCVIDRDDYTKNLTLHIEQSIIDNYCKVPYVVISHLHRNYLDPNRGNISEAAFGNAIAEEAYHNFHNYIADAQKLVKSTFGTTTAGSLTGIVGLMLDVHGYPGSDWAASGGKPYIQWGHQLNKNSMGQCPLDLFSGIYPDDDTYSQSSALPNQSLECLVRGPKALGSRLPPVGGVAGSCGTSLPSYDFPNVKELANDCAYCNNACNSTSNSCRYYTGGYDSKAHEYVDWQNAAGDLFNTVQVEFPFCIRKSSAMREQVADDLSVAMCSFLHDLYGAAAETCGPILASTPVPVTAAPVVPPTPSPVTAAPVVPPTPSPVTASPVVPPTPSPVAPTPVCSNDSIVLDQLLDVEIRKNADRGGTRGIIVVDKKTNLGEARALIKFPNINIPSGAVVTSAQLRFYTKNPTVGTISGYLMSTTWDNNSNWTDVSGGVDLNNSPPPPESFSFTPSVDEQDVMVTVSPAEIQDWVDGVTANEGWVMVSDSNNNWVFRSVNGKATQRPYLTINYMTCV